MMMTQNDCSEYLPQGCELMTAVSGKVLVDLKLEGGQFVYVLTDESDAHLVGYNDECGYYLRVPFETDVTFELHLAPDKDWAFDQKNPFTLKHSNDARYFTVKADPAEPRRITVQAKSTGIKPEKGPGVIQPYNLHVVLGQPGGSEITLKIDPDLKNPPPPGGG